jgi:ribosomal protein S18 acetylase RimI-like enzyme
MNVRVVTATLDHLNDLVPLFDAYCVFYQQPSNPQQARAFLSERFLLRENVVFLAYDYENHALGFTQLYPIFSSVYMQREWLLNDLYVAPEARGKRIGEKLIERSIEHAKLSGARGVMLETAHSNTPGQRLYERMGFVREDLEFRVYFKVV